MSLRITQSILYSRALHDIRRSTHGSVSMQEQIASGRRVSRPSDDPAGTLRILPLHAEVRDLGQLLENVSLARESLTVSASALQDGSALMARARELVVQAANSTYGQGERDRMAEEVDQLLQQMLSLANSRRGSRYVFAGGKTETQAFQLVNDAAGTRVRYDGDHASLDVDVAPGITTQINLPGSSVFQQRNRGATTIEGSSGAVPSGATDSGIGFDRLLVTFAGLSGAPSTISAGTGTTTALGPLAYTFTASPATLSIGGGPAVAIPATNAAFTTSDGRTLNLSVTGVPGTLTGTLTSQANLSIDGGTSQTLVDFTSSTVQVRNSLEDTVLNLNVAALRRTGTDLVKYTGTFDAFTALISVRDLLRNPLGEPNPKVGERLTAILADVDSAHEDVVSGLQSLGHRGETLELLSNRVAGLRDTSREALSDVEDTDMSDSIVAYNRQQIGYQAALQVAARILQTSLLNFLR